jgi:exonuclease SbcC
MKKINELTAEIKRLKKELQTQTKENIELKKVVQQTEGDFKLVLQTDFDLLNEELHNKKQDNELLTKNLQQTTEEIEQLKTELQNKIEKIDELNRDLQSKSEEIEKLKPKPQSFKKSCRLLRIIIRKLKNS